MLYNGYRICLVTSAAAFLLAAFLVVLAISGYYGSKVYEVGDSRSIVYVVWYYGGRHIKHPGQLLVISLIPLIFGFILRFLKKEFGKSLDHLVNTIE